MQVTEWRTAGLLPEYRAEMGWREVYHGRELGNTPGRSQVLTHLANGSGRFGPFRVSVVAFNDNLDPAAAAEQAAALALDPDVIGVVGPFSPETAAAAAPVLSRHSVPVEPVAGANSLDEDFSQEQALAKAAARNLLESLAADIQAHGRPTRPVTPEP